MILRLLMLTALFAAQTPPKPPDPVPPTPPTAPAAQAPVEVTVEKMTKVGADGVTLTADFYGLPFPAEDRPTFVCFHMEGGSRGEFAKIAPRFADFACCTLAVDLRTGKSTDGVANETATSAASVLKKTTFTNEEAFADVVTALKWAREMRPTSKLFVLGSGTSAALVLAAAGRDNACADALFVFSPGEDVAGWSISTEVRKITVPTYITCGGTAEEASHTRIIGNAIDKKLRRMVIPLNVPGATRGSSILVQTDTALRDRHWSSIVDMILKLAPLAPIAAGAPAADPPKKPQ